MLADRASNRESYALSSSTDNVLVSMSGSGNDGDEEEEEEEEYGKDKKRAVRFWPVNFGGKPSKRRRKAACVLLIATLCFVLLVVMFTTLWLMPELGPTTKLSPPTELSPTTKISHKPLVMVKCVPNNEQSSDLANSDQCPPAWVVQPCLCWLDGLHCAHLDNVTTLAPIFATISDYLAQTASSNLFDRLVIEDMPRLRQLEANFVSNLRFNEVTLKNLPRLRLFDRKAFGVCAGGHLKQLMLEGETSRFLADKAAHSKHEEDGLTQLAHVVARLPSLRRLFLDLHHRTHLPARVLAHPHLVDLSFNFNRARKGRLRVVADGAFEALPSLGTVDLFDQQIEVIGQAFRVRYFKSHHRKAPKARKLEVFLENNQLKSHSFVNHTFRTHDKCAISLHLEGNKIEYLDEKIFRPFFAANQDNRFDLGTSELQLDCRNFWVRKLATRFDQIESAYVNNSRILVALEPIDYRLANLRCTGDDLHKSIIYY